MSISRWILCTMAALLVAAPAAAQKPATAEIGGFGQWTHFDENAGRVNGNPEDGFGYGGRLGLFLSRNWQLEADGYYSPQNRELTEDFCCLGLFPDEVTASAFALRMNYNIPMGAADRTHLILGAGAVRTNYSFAGGNAADSSTASFGASALAGMRMAMFGPLALRVDGVMDYMPTHEPEANMNLHLRAGISMLLGGSAPAAMAPPPPARAPAVTPAPARAPAAAPAPAPAAENAITVCVVDMSQPSGLRMQSAFYRVQQRDTVVMLNGSRVPLSQVAGNAMVAHDATWFTRGEPLSLTVGTHATRYIAYDSARPIDASRVAYLGTINGYPVFADRDRAAGFAAALETARGNNANRDLGALLAGNRELRDAVEALPVLYVPMQRTGCVFQPMQMMPAVIKG